MNFRMLLNTINYPADGIFVHIVKELRIGIFLHIMLIDVKSAIMYVKVIIDK